MPIVDPFDTAPKAASPSPRAQQRQLQMRSTAEDIATAPLRRAQIAQDIATAPVTRARGQVALEVDQATKDAAIRKELANANDAEYSAQIKRLQAKYPQLNEQQILAGARAQLMAEGERAYSTATAQGYDPGSARNLLAGGLEKVPLAGDTLASFTRDPTAQLAVTGQKQFTEGVTRSLTGAGLRGDERSFSSSEFFPLAGESAAVRAQKARLRQKYLTQLIQAAGPAYSPDASVPPAQGGGGRAALPQGFKFLGEVK